MASASSPGFDTVGTIAILIGVWLLYAAVKNKQPIETAKAIIKNPRSARSQVEQNQGYETATAEPVAGGGTWSASNDSDPSTLTTSKKSSDTSSDYSGSTSAVVAFAEKQLGKPYVWGGIGTNNKAGGFDCSGLVISAWKKAGVSLPHYTGSLLASPKLKRVDKKGPYKVGDLIFPFPGHVQLYVGNGEIIEAPGRGRKIRRKKLGSVWQVRRVKGSKNASV